MAALPQCEGKMTGRPKGSRNHKGRKSRLTPAMKWVLANLDKKDAWINNPGYMALLEWARKPKNRDKFMLRVMTLMSEAEEEAVKQEEPVLSLIDDLMAKYEETRGKKVKEAVA